MAMHARTVLTLTFDYRFSNFNGGDGASHRPVVRLDKEEKDAITLAITKKGKKVEWWNQTGIDVALTPKDFENL
jgi:hypothetical protein